MPSDDSFKSTTMFHANHCCEITDVKRTKIQRYHMVKFSSHYGDLSSMVVFLAVGFVVIPLFAAL